MTIGETLYFMTDKGEQKDFAVYLPKGDYHIILDVKRMDEKLGNIIGNLKLLKTTGSIINNSFLYINELHAVARVGRTFHISKPFEARLRLYNQETPLEVWMTIFPSVSKKSIPFAFFTKPLMPLAIGTNEGTGGQLGAYEWAYHTLNLPAGRWDISLYFKQLDRVNTNLMGQIEQVDPFGLQGVKHLVFLNEIGVEARQEKRIVVAKPQTLIFRVTNTNNRPVEYVVGILEGSK